jgi:3'-phosphoadenosine 5'-phosphosulfate sulfotransferase (PAPS reductase)/FAD synthetase
MTQYKQLSLSLLPEGECLSQKIEASLGVLASLPPNKYTLAYSGGKDSTALVGLLFRAQRLKIPLPDIEVLFADTRLETEALYALVSQIETFCQSRGVSFRRVTPANSYWQIQFVWGYPIPSYNRRWCTNYLKIKPQKKGPGAISITGRHYGESSARDTRLKKAAGCSSGECGADKLTDSIDPILPWRNCDVWDFLFLAEEVGDLPDGIFNGLQSTYQAHESKAGSLRMGCFMCPVIGKSTLASNHDPEGMIFREALDALAERTRLRSPKSLTQTHFKGKPIPPDRLLGPIAIWERRAAWAALPQQILVDRGYLANEEIGIITAALQSDYAYPKSYSREWIDSEHARLGYR